MVNFVQKEVFLGGHYTVLIAGPLWLYRRSFCHGSCEMDWLGGWKACACSYSILGE